MARNQKPADEKADDTAGEETPATETPRAQLVEAGAEIGLSSDRMVAVIAATVPRRRRAGRSFGPTPARVPVDQLTDEDFDALAADPLLKIHMEPAEDPASE